MEDAQQESKPGDRADQPDGTQKTTVTETPVAPPAEEVSPRATADTSQELLSTSSATTDTSMTDAPSKPPLKLVREREDDNEEEPAAKRAKTESDGEEIRVEPKPDVADAGADESAIDESAIDDSVIAQPARSAGPVVPTHDSEGRVKYLNDPSLDRNPITPYQNREIRRALALVKKTKNGMVFKDPVSKAWPQLWESYIAKVEHPTDISTIERKLRETDLTGSFATLGDFKREVRLMEHNSMVFNGEAHAVTAQAKSVVDQVMERIAAIPAEEAARSDKKEPKQQPTRHAEPRAVTQQRRPSRGAATSPVEKMVDNVVAVPASGVPVIRRQSTKNDEDRPKRPIHPPKNKDLEYEPKNFKKQKLSPDFRFCDEVLTELKKKKYDFNQFFLYPVDPILHGVPTYWSVIKKPMDLETMTGKLHRGEYKKTKDFENDFLQIVRNCVKFNGDANPVTHQVHQLEALFKEKWAERDEWIANHAPPAAAASATSSHSGGADGKDEEDEEDAAEDQGGDDQVKQARALIDGLNARLTEETEKLTKMLTTSDMISVQVQRGMVTTLQDEIIKASQKLTEVEKQQPKPAKPKAAAAAASKRKSTGAAGAGAAGAGGSKKAGGGSGGSGSAGGKKGGGGGGGGAKKAPKARVIGQAEKDIIAEGINDLDGAVLEQAIDIIKKDTNQTVSLSSLSLSLSLIHSIHTYPTHPRLYGGYAFFFLTAVGLVANYSIPASQENDTGELELDIEQLSMPALIKLYDIIVKTFPHLRKNEPEPAHEPTAPARDRPKASKSKKNKPMNKVEQERKIAQLREVQAAFARPGSGSQEPVPSVEDAAGQDSDDEEEDSEEE